VSIDFKLETGIALITINRPERLNAMDADHYKGLSEAWQRVRDDSDVRVAIVTGAGERSFTTGADIKSFVAAPSGIEEMWLTQRDQLLNRGLEVWKPVIAAVNGYCLGGGMTLLLGTDIRLAAPHATFSLAEVKRGIIAGNGGTQRILSQLPYAIGMEMLLTGDSLDAETAARWGLVNRVVPAENLLAEAKMLAQKIAKNAPLAVQAAKELAVRAREMPLATGLRMEQVVNRMLQFSEDAEEGPKAFAEKRTPAFKGK
jgi:E-phenylitaconyl-CoA hydratase